MLDAAPALAALADPLRLRTVRLLAKEELQVREIQRILEAAQSRVSNHLAVLRHAGLVETRRTNGAERYAATAPGAKLWESVSDAVTDQAFAADDDRLRDVLEERTAVSPEGGFDAVAGEWDRIQGPFYASGAREAALLKLVPRGLSVVDVGCGTGLLTLGLATVADEVHAVDASERMVRLAREKVRRAGLANVTVKKATAERLPFGDASFDAVFAFHLLRHLARPADALAEFGRVAKDGGRVVLVELEPHGHRALREATGSTHLGLPRETVRAGLKRAGFIDSRFSALDAYRVPSEEGETSLPTYLVDAVRAARGEQKEPS